MQAVLSQASLGDGAQSVIVVIEEFVAGEIQNGHGVLSRNNCFAEETREKIRSARKGIGASNPLLAIDLGISEEMGSWNKQRLEKERILQYGEVVQGAEGVFLHGLPQQRHIFVVQPADVAITVDQIAQHGGERKMCGGQRTIAKARTQSAL